jgi:hypothetical protein
MYIHIRNECLDRQHRGQFEAKEEIRLTCRRTEIGALDDSFIASFEKISTARSRFSFNARILIPSSWSSTVKFLNNQVR